MKNRKKTGYINNMELAKNTKQKRQAIQQIGFWNTTVLYKNTFEEEGNALRSQLQKEQKQKQDTPDQLTNLLQINQDTNQASIEVYKNQDIQSNREKEQEQKEEQKENEDDFVVIRFTKLFKFVTSKGYKRFFKPGDVLKVKKQAVDIFLSKKCAVVLHEEIKDTCISPFVCELIRDRSCVFIDSSMKWACCGPYKITPDGGIISYLGILNNKNQ